MFIKGEITVYGLKSDRRNSKSVSKSMQIVGDSAKMKSEYTLYDIWDFMSFMCNSPYKKFKVVAYSNFRCISTINNYQSMGDIESVINLLYDQMRLLNFKEWNFTKEEMHLSPNTKYLIHQYYHPAK